MNGQITVTVKYGELQSTFTGDAEQAWRSLNKFFHETLPAFDVAEKLTLRIDMQTLAKDCEGVVAFSPEGVNLLAPRNKITDNEALSMFLVANRLGLELGKLSNDSISKIELQNKLGKSPKIASARLGELVKNQLAIKNGNGDYRITTLGVLQAQKEILPRIKVKMGI